MNLRPHESVRHMKQTRGQVVVEREDLSVSWGVELTSDSKRSLTITRISAGGVRGEDCEVLEVKAYAAINDCYENRPKVHQV